MAVRNIGRFRCTSWVECRMAIDGGVMFGLIPKVVWSREWSSDAANRVEVVCRPLVICTGKHNLLIDPGVGEKISERRREQYAVHSGEEALEVVLARLGLTPDDIDAVLLSHLHFDHVGGATVERQGRIIPRFPNATFFFPQRQYRWASSPSERDRAGYLRRDFQPLVEEGRVRFIEAGELFPGVRAEETNGHTPGQLLYWIESEGESLLFGGDLLPTASHLHLPFSMAYDLLPLETMAEKPRLLDQAIARRSLIYLYHDPKLALIRAQKKDSRYSLLESFPTL